MTRHDRTDQPIALITGATDGIGRAIARTLGAAGWQIGVCSRTPAKVDAAVAELQAAGVRAAGVAGDVGLDADVARIVGGITSALGPIDTLVNNAGLFVSKRIEELSVTEWDATIATNLRALFLTCRAVLPGMRQRQAGDIVNIASLSGRNGLIGGTAYAASKHAVLGFSKSLMLETRKDGVRVIALCPGSVDTALRADATHLSADLSRALQPQDVADMVLHALRLPRRAMVSELDIRPSNP